MIMARYRVTVWASYETEVEVNSQDEAEELAAEEAPFSWVDHCYTEEATE